MFDRGTLMKHCHWLLLVVLFMLVSCVEFQTKQETICLPPGVSAGFLLWPVTSAVSGTYDDQPAILMAFTQDGKSIEVIINLSREIIVLDDHPDQDDVPAWFKLPGKCQWQHEKPSYT